MSNCRILTTILLATLAGLPPSQRALALETGPSTFPPVALFETDSGEHSLAARFVTNADTNGYYAVDVLPNGSSSPKDSPELRIPFANIRLIQFKPSSERQLYPQLRGSQMFFAEVTTTDGTIYESRSASVLDRVENGGACRVDGRTCAILYLTTSGEKRQLEQECMGGGAYRSMARCVKTIILNDSNTITARWDQLEGQTRVAEKAALERKVIADKAASDSQKAELQAAAQRSAFDLRETKTFRSNIKVGTETNCGPVLETRANLVKVYTPVKDYGNEHWIRLDAIFPPSANCSFLNGQYVPPQ
jgi:hypothetical protein